MRRPLQTNVQNRLNYLDSSLPPDLWKDTKSSSLCQSIWKLALRSETQAEREKAIPDLTSRSRQISQIVRAFFILSDLNVTDVHRQTAPQCENTGESSVPLYPCCCSSGPFFNVTQPSAVNKRRQNAKGKIQPQLRRKSTQLQEIRDLSQRKFKQAEKQTRSSPRITTRQHGIGQRPPRAEGGILKTPKKCQLILCCEYYHSMLTGAAKQRRVPVDKDETQHESSLTSPEVNEACQLPPARLRS
jgi:hypothetical protein